MEFPLIGGAYATRSTIASSQKCINYYPEANREDSTTRYTYYQRPGLVPKLKVGAGPIRYLYRPSTGVGGFVISGSEVYRINTDWTTAFVGNVTANKTNICSMIDNGIQLMAVDGSQNGWILNIQPGQTFFSMTTDTTIDGPGTGYAVNDTVTFAGGTTTQSATATVTSVNSSGGVTGLAFPNPNGLYTVAPSNPVSVQSTSGGGSGLLVNTTFEELGWTQIVDPTGFFTGADKVDTLDSFILWNRPGTKQFGSTYSNQTTPFDPLFFASKAGYPDPIMSIFINRHEILLLGLLKSEAWYDAGNPTFPFAALPGAYIEHGVAAIYSVAAQDIAVYWLSQNLQGEGMVLRYRGYMTTNISNYALGEAIRQMATTVGISDAIGYTYQQDNHVFYVLHFPAGNQTWVYDESIGNPGLAWHQEAWTNPTDGSLNRHRGNCAAFINGINVVGDRVDGTIYEMSLDSYVDLVEGTECPISCVRTFPNVGVGVNAAGQPVKYDGSRMVVNSFVADFEGGASSRENQISLRWSIDRGKSWGDAVIQSSGEIGEFEEQPTWRNLGIARYPVFELSHSIRGPAALNGAWISVRVSEG